MAQGSTVSHTLNEISGTAQSPHQQPFFRMFHAETNLFMHKPSCSWCAGGMKQVVKLVQRGSEAPPAAGAAHALAAFTTGRNASIYRATVQAANGVPALLM